MMIRQILFPFFLYVEPKTRLDIQLSMIHKIRQVKFLNFWWKQAKKTTTEDDDGGGYK